MKSGIHPKYEDAKITCACGRVTETRSTVGEIHVEICSHCHPFFTGRQKLVDTAGRVERFKAKYGGSSAAEAATPEVQETRAEAAAEAAAEEAAEEVVAEVAEEAVEDDAPAAEAEEAVEAEAAEAPADEPADEPVAEAEEEAETADGDDEEASA